MATLQTVTVMTLRRLRAGTSGYAGRTCQEELGGGGSGGCPHLPVLLQLSQQSRCPDFFLFLCRLLSPLLKVFALAAVFLHQGQLPDTGKSLPSLQALGSGLCPCQTLG